MNKFFKKYWGLLLVLFFSWWAIKPLFHPGFFPMHDNTQVVRVYEMARALRDGQFPVRWVQDLGYGFGYPIFNFYSPLPYYAGSIFVILGLDTLAATKLMFVIGILLSGIFMYLLAREFWGELGGLVSGLFFMYAPYHAVQVYIRGSVGEFWALAFIPLVFLGFYKVFRHSVDDPNLIDQRAIRQLADKNQKSKPQIEIKKRIWGWIVIGSVGYAGVILSHNITALMLTLFLGVVIICCLCYTIKSKKLLTSCFLLLISFLGLSLSAFFWLPAIFEAKFVNIGSLIQGTNNFRLHFLCPWQLWDSPWGFGGSTLGCDFDGMSFKVGKIHLLTALAALFLLFSKEKIKKRVIPLSASLPVVMAFCFLLSAFLTTEYSKFVWEAITPMAYIQYPWRFLVFIIFSVSLLAGAVISWFKNYRLKLFTLDLSASSLQTGLLLFALLFYNAKYFQPQKYLDVEAVSYTNEENIKWTTSKISDEYLPQNFPIPKESSEIVREKLLVPSLAVVSELEIKSQKYNFTINSPKEIQVLVNTAYFPGWQAFVDKKISDFLVKDGKMVFIVLPGEHKVAIVFGNTPVRSLGNTISLLSFALLVFISLYVRKKTFG